MQEPGILHEGQYESDVLDRIVTACLWHEPHSLKEMIDEALSSDDPMTNSKQAFKRQACWALSDAIACGYLKRGSSGFYVGSHNIWCPRVEHGKTGSSRIGELHGILSVGIHCSRVIRVRLFL